MTTQLENTIREWKKNSEGWWETDRLLEMAQMILDYKPEVCVEVGTFGGRGFITQGLALKELGKGQVFGIDPWYVNAALEGENPANQNWWKNNVDLNLIHQYCMNAVWKFGLEGICIPIRARSEHVFQLFHNIDTLTIDGNHSELSSTRDVMNYLPLVYTGGLVIMDDCDWPSTKKAQSLVEACCKEIKNGENGHYRVFIKE